MKQTRQQIRIYTNTEEPHNINMKTEEFSDSDGTESEIDEYLNENPLLSNPDMPIFDVATGKMDKPSCNLEPPYIWLMDRSDRLGSALPLGKKSVAISVVDNKIVVGKPWGKEILPYDDAKQTETILQLARCYNIAVQDMRVTDRKLKNAEMSKKMSMEFILALEAEIDDNLFEDLMISYKIMCEIEENVSPPTSYDFSHTHTSEKIYLFHEIAGLKVRIQELEQKLQQASGTSSQDERRGPPASSPARHPDSRRDRRAQRPDSERAQRAQHHSSRRDQRVRHPDSRRAGQSPAPAFRRARTAPCPDSPEHFPTSRHQALTKILPVGRPVNSMPHLDPEDSSDENTDEENSSAEDSRYPNRVITAEKRNFTCAHVVPPRADAIGYLQPPSDWLMPDNDDSLNREPIDSLDITDFSLSPDMAFGLKISPIHFTNSFNSAVVDAITDAQNVQGQGRQ